MSKPQVIVVPAHAGIGTVPPVQIPLAEGSNITLTNLSSNLGLTLCNDSQFNSTTTWPLAPNSTNPQPGVNNLWVQNSNSTSISILVLQGIIPVFNPQAINQGGLLQVSNSSLSGSTYQALLPTPLSGYAYRLQSVCCINQTAAAILFLISSLYLNVVLIPFFARTVPANDAVTFVLNGLLIPTEIQSSPVVTNGFGVVLNYDLVKI